MENPSLLDLVTPSSPNFDSSSSSVINTYPTSTYTTTNSNGNLQSSTFSFNTDNFSYFSKSIWFITWMFFQIATYIIYYIPSFIFSILSTTFSVTLSFSTLLIIVLIISGATWAYIRYKYLTVYSRLPEEPKRQEPLLDVFVENTREERKSRLSYLDEFLTAIKIFGYLETPIFHELTKSMQTQKLEPSEVLFLDDENLGFTICVEGEINVYCEVGSDNSSLSSPFNSDYKSSRDIVVVDNVRYQLLNNIKSGSPLSSFVKVLNIMTNPTLPTHNSSSPPPQQANNDSQSIDNFLLDQPNTPSYSSESSSPPLMETNENRIKHPNLIAIPKSNATISIIPKEAFLRLVYKYPKAASQIVQMILTKLYRVTFQASHNYLDLTSDIFQSEININKNSVGEKLPKYLYDIALDTLDEIDGDLLMHSSGKTRPSTSDSRVSKETLTNSNTTLPNGTIDGKFKNNSSSFSRESSPKVEKATVGNRPYPIRNDSFDTSSRYINLKAKQTSANNPGDLLSNVPLISRSEKLFGENEQDLKDLREKLLTSGNGDDSTDDNQTLRKFIAESICRIVGIEKFPILNFKNQPRNSFSSELNSPVITGLTVLKDASSRVTVTPPGSTNNLSKENNLRSFSTSSLKSLNSSTFSDVDTDPVINSYRVHHRDSVNSYSNTYYSSSAGGAHKRAQSISDDALSNLIKSKKDLADNLVMMKLPADSILIEENEQTPGLFYIIEGTVDVTFKKKQNDLVHSNILNDNIDELDDESDEKVNYLYSLHSGAIAGYLGAVINTRSFVTATAKTDVYVAFLPIEQIEALGDRYPHIQLSLSKKLLSVLDKKIILLDYALEWTHSSAGNSLYSQGDPANGIYIVLNGRFRSVVEKSKLKESATEKINKTTDKIKSRQQRGKKNSLHSTSSSSTSKFSNSVTGSSSDDVVILEEHGQGESLGEVEVLTKTARQTTVVAIRDSETARIPRALFEMIAIGNPSIMVKVSRIVAQRVRRSISDSYPTVYSRNPTISSKSHLKDDLVIESNHVYRTITVLPVNNGLPVLDFGRKLAYSFENLGQSVKVLTQASTLSKLGKYAFDKLAKMKQSGYFSELEERYNIIIYVADTPVNSSWTRTCIAQGDCILLVADANSSPDIGDYERLLVKTRTTAHTELVLLHPERYVEPGLTNKWLKNRIWVHSHHHVEMKVPNLHQVAMEVNGFPFVNDEESDNLTISNKLYGKFLRPSTIDFLSKNSSKFRQLKTNIASITKRVESLMGNNSYKNTYHPFEHHKDDFMRLARILNGKAVGLVLGGGGARGLSHIGVIKALEAHGIPVDLIGGTSIGSFVGGLYAKDYDMLPVYGRAKQFSGRMASIWRMAFDITYPVTSYITGHEFNRGIWKAFGGSRIEDFWIRYYTNSTNITESMMEIHSSGYAWRYIRASMSLAGLLPPITDNGNMLLDGGYVDNLTVQEMKRRGAKIVFAVDVGSEDDRTPQYYGDTLSGLWVLFNRINPFSKYPNVPSMADIQMRLAYVASVNALEKAKTTEGCIYLRPPIEGYATLDFGKFEELNSLGFRYANLVFKEMKENGTMPVIESTRKKDANKFLALKRRNSI